MSRCLVVVVAAGLAFGTGCSDTAPNVTPKIKGDPKAKLTQSDASSPGTTAPSFDGGGKLK